MLEQPPRVLVAYAVGLIAILLVGARWLDRESVPTPAPGAEPVAVERSSDERLTVHVAGAVRRPGVYRLRSGARVESAVERAGGATRDADLAQVNLAAKAEDGRQILVPALPSATDSATTPSAVPADAPINLNTATLEELDTLDGIGPAMAQQILDYRDEHSGFGSVDELAQVPGIGPKRLASLREQVRV